MRNQSGRGTIAADKSVFGLFIDFVCSVVNMREYKMISDNNNKTRETSDGGGDSVTANSIGRRKLRLRLKSKIKKGRSVIPVERVGNTSPY